MFFNIFCLALLFRCFKYDSAFWIMIWPGTVIHEFCHWLVGKCLLAEPVAFSLMPKSEGNSLTLGSVSFRNISWWNALPTGLAPLLTIPAVLWLSTHVQFGWNWTSALEVWALSSALSQCWPSGADFRIAFESWFGVIFWCFLGFLGLGAL